jgi:hypothetical protein
VFLDEKRALLDWKSYGATPKSLKNGKIELADYLKKISVAPYPNFSFCASRKLFSKLMSTYTHGEYGILICTASYPMYDRELFILQRNGFFKGIFKRR